MPWRQMNVAMQKLSYNSICTRLLSLNDQENTQISPDPFPCEKMGSGNEMTYSEAPTRLDPPCLATNAMGTFDPGPLPTFQFQHATLE